ncbi:MAG: 50S ribosomal protein L11 methyltransferase [Elusimicrobiota bacterium]|jgi:2-polyprenyl-3-methyl-5-hydroxy-6-metoxy-1,4-benzoquinol methylase
MPVTRPPSPHLDQADPWASAAMHQALINDRGRTLNYKKAIEKRVKKTDVVLDMGCGTGILAFFAAKKGCKRLYAVDNADILHDAMSAARLNALDDVCIFSKTDIFAFRPKEKIDVLLHEQIGNFLWDEDLVSKVAHIRDHFLRKSGAIIPSRIALYLVPINYSTESEKALLFWSRKHYGLSFSNLGKTHFTQKISDWISPQIIRLQDSGSFLCPPQSAHTVDLWKAKSIPERITAVFRLKKGSRLSGVCAYFKVILDEKNAFSNHPAAPASHWGQIFLPCLQPLSLPDDSILDFKLWPDKKPEKWRFRFDIRSAAPGPHAHGG